MFKIRIRIEAIDQDGELVDANGGKTGRPVTSLVFTKLMDMGMLLELRHKILVVLSLLEG